MFVQIFERIADALAETARDVAAYAKQRPAFAPIAERMLAQWALGRIGSLALS